VRDGLAALQPEDEVIMVRSRAATVALLLALLLIAYAPASAPAQGGAPAPAQEEKPGVFVPPRLDLTIWTIIVFAVLLWFLGRYAWKPMLQGLQKRENDIQSAIQDARAAREEATRLRQEVQAEREKIEAMRRDIIQRAEADAQRRADEVTATAEAKMKADHERMMRELETKGDQLWQELVTKVTDLAAAISSKAIRRNLAPEDHRRFVDESLAELRQAGNGQKTPASA
jgi:F-type H+-transporting ATPase subunit b